MVRILAWAALAALVSAGAVAEKIAHPYPVRVGKSFRDKPWSPEMVVIPAGVFMMGSTEEETTREARDPALAATERPRHEVRVEAPLAVGKYPVTRGDYERFIKATGHPVATACHVMVNGKWGLEENRSFRDPAFPETDRGPAICVGWQDAADYAAWLSQQTGHRYRLLHEAEFEYAIRGGTVTARWWGDSQDGLCKHVNAADRQFDKVAPGDPRVNRSCDDGYPYASPVGSFPPNPFGLYDIMGNVWQWTADCFIPNYDQAPTVASADVTAADCGKKVVRGGSWHNYPNVMRAANRTGLPIDMHSSSLGFRIARDPDR